MTTDLTSPPPAAKTEPTNWWRRDAAEPVRRNLGLTAVLAALVVIGLISANDRFLTSGNILNVLTQASAIGVIAIGMTFVIIGGGIDLSVGALTALAAVWCTTVATQDFGVPGMVFTAVIVGAVAGTVNGLLIAYGRLVPFIATLAMMVSARGLAAKISDKKTQEVDVGAVNRFAENKFLGIPLLVWLFAAVAAVGWVLLNRTAFGRRTVAVGGNAEAARLAGINVRRQTVYLYALSGVCCGIAAIMVVAQANAGSSGQGDLYELDAIAAVIIGGTVLTGGRGTVVGSLLGVVVFTTITNLFILNNLPAEVQNIVKGAIIAGAVLVQQFQPSKLLLRRRP
ncbi:MULTISPECIES: ABC transporter permease [unclassified Streptomyces]|uniref:ABC transporter permease n=1 Tax=unclassified Streptomyces TaxID=2593676 RepID=UPI0036E0239C